MPNKGFILSGVWYFPLWFNVGHKLEEKAVEDNLFNSFNPGSIYIHEDFGYCLFLGLTIKESGSESVCLKFNDELANLSASEFVDDILINSLAIKKLIVGDDFHFAKNREGNYEYLLETSKEKNFEVFKTNTYEENGLRISSTLIRNLLTEGNIEVANRYLGRFFVISGRVIHGDKRGKRLGFPTVNIKLNRYLSPVTGIFSGRIRGIGNKQLDAVIYVGTKPVYSGIEVLLEAHILDFDGDLYGRHIQVEFHNKIRDDQHITSEQEMLKQIKLDINETRQYFKKMRVINN